jgi:hypothetical protein
MEAATDGRADRGGLQREVGARQWRLFAQAHGEVWRQAAHEETDGPLHGIRGRVSVISRLRRPKDHVPALTCEQVAGEGRGTGD